ncbi:hypothetical protein F0562_014965 [Nyssa sinensis]|uniref:Uncharacterized protein n=1 Tax=Nyssa sinensis TaxID=561372 RepID=A0A5J4ZPE8_9ASTE|nr:hypothetical protein F0562_014965 [Nyssa sinensis]
MGSEVEPQPCSTPKLPLFSIPPMQSPEPSGMLTPPLYTSASVPFRWEEEPGKPRPCAILTLCNPNNNGPKCLELPPRLLMESKFTKTPSPTTVLDGPYVGRPIFQSSSFRFIGERLGSFGSSSSLSPERGQLGAMVLSKRGHKERGFFGTRGQRTLKIKVCEKDVEGGSCVFSSSMDIADDESSNPGVKMTRNGSFTTLSQPRSPFWAAIYKGFKHVIPWSRKSKKGGLII